MMEKIKEELSIALQMLSAIPLNGNGVDYMAAAKQRIRRALRIAESMDGEVKPKDG